MTPLKTIGKRLVSALYLEVVFDFLAMQGEDNIRSLSEKIRFIYIRCETGKMFQINMAAL
jgi:hypothetical protein